MPFSTSNPTAADRPMAPRVAANSFFNAIRSAVLIGSSFLTSVLIARSLGPNGTGAWSYAVWLSSVITTVVCIGSPTTLTKYLSEYLSAGKKAEAAGLVRSLLRFQLLLLVAGLAVALALQWRIPFFADREIAVLAIVLAAPQAANATSTAILAGLERYGHSANVAAYGSVTQIVLVAAAVTFHAGVRSVLLAAIAGSCVAAAAGYLYAAKLLRERGVIAGTGWHRKIPANVRSFLWLTSWGVLVDLISWSRAETYFIERYSGIREVAFYGLAYAIAYKGTQLGEMVTQTLMPTLSSSYATGGAPRVGSYFPTLVRYLDIMLVPLCVAGVICCRPFIQMIYGRDFLPMLSPLYVLLLAVPFSASSEVASAVVSAVEKPRFIAITSTALAIIKIGLAVVLIPRFNILGAAFVNVLPRLAGLTIGVIYIARVTGVPYPWRSAFKIYVSAGLALLPAAIAAANGHRALTAALLVLAAPVYVALLRRLREVGDPEKQAVQMLWQHWKTSRGLS